jgi:spore coat protein U-like protein
MYSMELRKHLWTLSAHCMLGLLPALAAGVAQAAVDCSVSTVGVNFGTYDPLALTPDDSAGNVAITCSRIAPVDTREVQFLLSLSRGSSGTYAQRTMRDGSAILTYNLFRNAARTEIWGDGSNSGSPLEGTLRFGSSQTSQTSSYPVYGRVQARQDVRPGNYSDTIILTVTF